MAWRSGTNMPGGPPPPPQIPFSSGRAAFGGVPLGLSFGFGCSALEAAPAAAPLRWGELSRQPARSSDAAAMRTAPKRRRSESDEDIPFAPADDEAAKRRRPAAARADDTRLRADLGRLLASLDRPALLSLVLDLTSDAAVAERAYTLLPTPSLESVEACLEAFEARVRASLPLAPGAVRESYVWPRMRGVLAELATELDSFVPLFSPAPRSHERDLPHPATTFAFLHLATLRALRIARLLPSSGRARRPCAATPLRTYESALHAPDARDAVATHVLPVLLREWEHWQCAVDHAVNQEGRIYSQDTVVGWERLLATLGAERANPTEQAVRAALDVLVAQMSACIGWLTGHRGIAMDE